MPVVGLFGLAALFLMLGGPRLQQPLTAILSWVNVHFGWLYLLVFIVNFTFLLWLAFSRYGNIKLGKPNDKPIYGNFKWGSMIFATGIDASIMMLSITDPLQFIQAPPFGLKPYSDSAYIASSALSQFNWGPMAWMMFAPAAILIGYVTYRKNKPTQKLSDNFSFLQGNRPGKKVLRVLIDFLVVIGIIGGLGSSIGMEVPRTSRVFSAVTNIPNTIWLQLGIFFVLFVLLGLTVYKGLNGGIDRLSMFNIYLAVVFLALILAVSPTGTLLADWGKSLGVLAQKFIPMSTNIHPSPTQQDTIFYWGWWLTFMPLMGTFIAKISRGRTIRQILLGMLGYGVPGCFLFHAILGGYAMWLQRTGVIDLVSVLNHHSQADVIVAVIATLPLKKLMLIFYAISCFIFLAATISGAAYVLSSFTSTPLYGKEPSRFNRMSWVFIFLAFAFSLVLVGGFEVIQTISVLAGLPLTIVCLLVLFSIYRLVKHDRELIFTPTELKNTDRRQKYTVERKFAVRGKLILSFNNYHNLSRP
ncbi:MAG TPA: BCCT family transporter [Candidatus Ligilactobacillus excrementipullorum]|nr:BCCT family transporter [Candidatus Ligilactobacillus excrementipullorum]